MFDWPHRKLSKNTGFNLIDHGFKTTAPIGTKTVHSVQKFILFNILKSELRYCNPVWNGSATKDIALIWDTSVPCCSKHVS